MSINNPVKTLNAQVARKIAAGEVIDRPSAIIRELMDNAIDSQAKAITVEISAGGIEKIRIIDNGCGMTKEDLQVCARPHATSKITTEEDLMNLSTLGFRGEALASIAAVTRLSITSGGWKMKASITEDHILEAAAQLEGTIVQAEGLFENLPARRVFLKRPATEATMCKNMFIEKALSRPDMAFRFINDGEIKLDLPAGQTLLERFVAASGFTEDKALFNQFGRKDSKENPDWSFEIVIGEPGISRPTKKDINIYVNGRKIQEYSLVQAIEYGGQGFFPNGTYPVAALFAEVNPKLVDFNIHPAKKEARFYDISSLHHGVSSTVKAFFQKYTRQNFDQDKNTDDTIANLDFNSSSPYERHITYKNASHGEKTFSDFRSRFLPGEIKSYSSDKKQSLEENEIIWNALNSSADKKQNFSYKANIQNFNDEIKDREDGLSLVEEALAVNNKFQEENQKIKYIGPCLGTFLLAEKNNCLYIFDQHAAHERILFDSIMNNQGERQSLLIPYKIPTESKSQDNQIEKLKDRLFQIGFEFQKKSEGLWEVLSIPQRWTATEFDLRTLLFVKQFEPEQIIRSIAAMTACKAAIKDGYVIDDETAAKLIEEAFSLEDPHCPHGRPIYTVISREQLFSLVKRT